MSQLPYQAGIQDVSYYRCRC